jgi:hypothetical protein
VSAEAVWANTPCWRQPSGSTNQSGILFGATWGKGIASPDGSRRASHWAGAWQLLQTLRHRPLGHQHRRRISGGAEMARGNRQVERHGA